MSSCRGRRWRRRTPSPLTSPTPTRKPPRQVSSMDRSGQRREVRPSTQRQASSISPSSPFGVLCMQPKSSRFTFNPIYLLPDFVALACLIDAQPGHHWSGWPCCNVSTQTTLQEAHGRHDAAANYVMDNFRDYVPPIIPKFPLFNIVPSVQQNFFFFLPPGICFLLRHWPKFCTCWI